MVRLPDDFFKKPENSEQNLNFYQSQAGKGLMETEGRTFSDLYRNTSEDLFIKSLMESSIGMPAPTMEMLGFKNNNNNIQQSFRTDSEELFKSWLTNGEASIFSNHGYNSPSIALRTRQASRMISTELANLATSQQNGSILQKKISIDNICSQNNSTANGISNDFNPLRSAVERNVQANNLHLAKAWFHHSQPMTRSRSSELRRRYVAMQNAQSTFGQEAMNNASIHAIDKSKEEYANPSFNNIPMTDMPNQMGTFMSPSNSSSSPFDTPPMDNFDNVSNVVSMLKGTLERKKLGMPIEKETIGDSTNNGLYQPQNFIANTMYTNEEGSHIHGISHTFQQSSVQDFGVIEMMQGSIGLDFEGIVNPTNPIQLSAISRETSQSECSAAAPVISSGFEACDGPSNSSQVAGNWGTSKREVRNSRSSENEFRERIMDNLKDERKKRTLVRYGSVTSAASVDQKGDPTKKRRVERSRKMAEAKERNLTPSVPSDMQTVLKRSENLEKEVRSLKLNLSFMNRKDSEQTKQIEELQKQNEELADEKERLLEAIERMIPDTET
ncbi:hypothetical protein ACFE04_023649 [Oxalis oulophora]